MCISHVDVILVIVPYLGTLVISSISIWIFEISRDARIFYVEETTMSNIVKAVAGIKLEMTMSRDYFSALAVLFTQTCS